MDQGQRFLGESMARSGEPPLMSHPPALREPVNPSGYAATPLTEPLHCLLLFLPSGTVHLCSQREPQHSVLERRSTGHPGLHG